MPRAPDDPTRGAPEPGQDGRGGESVWPSTWRAEPPADGLVFGAGPIAADTARGAQIVVPGRSSPIPVAFRLLEDEVDGLFGVELRGGRHHAALRAAALGLGPARVDDLGLLVVTTPTRRFRIDDLDRVVVILAHDGTETW